MRFVRKIVISSDGSLYFCKEFATIKKKFAINNSLEDKKNFFFNKKKRMRKYNIKSSLKYKKKYLKQELEYSQVARHSFLIRAFKGSNPFIPIKQ